MTMDVRIKSMTLNIKGQPLTTQTGIPLVAGEIYKVWSAYCYFIIWGWFPSWVCLYLCGKSGDIGKRKHAPRLMILIWILLGGMTRQKFCHLKVSHLVVQTWCAWRLQVKNSSCGGWCAWRIQSSSLQAQGWINTIMKTILLY